MVLYKGWPKLRKIKRSVTDDGCSEVKWCIEPDTGGE